MSTTVELAPLPTHAPDHGPPPPSAFAAISGIATVLVGLAGVVLGGAALVHDFAAIRIGWLLPLVGVVLRPDPLGGLFAAVVGAVALPVGGYAIGYARRVHLPATALAVLPLFVAAMVAVPLAGSITTFLLAWELMAIASLVLVLAEHHRPQTRTAAAYYAVLTQFGFVTLLVGLVVLSSAAHADTFTGLVAHADRVGPGTRAAVFVLTAIGFGSKAGLVPLHAWLPRAHPEAPSPVSALMSAAMVALGVYGLLRLDLQLLGPGPRWWGLTLLLVGALSAVYGVLQASTATDLKRLLAHSTTEHLGLITLALGAATLLSSVGAQAAAAVALAAALLHVVGHAAFKTLAFLAAGSVLAGTGLRDLDQMGGLARRMPATTVLFGVASLGACGLPLGAGFVSEWLLVQSLIHAPRHADRVTAAVVPVGVGAVALTTGLGVAAMVKAFGVGFLARPRSRAATEAREASVGMLLGMGVAAAACAVLAVAPFVLAGPLRRVLDTLPAGAGSRGPHLGALLRLPGTGASMSPMWLAVALVAATAGAAALTAWGAHRRPRPAALPLWACGADELNERMQYTATSFAEPLQRVFDDVLRPDIDVEVTHHSESRYLVEKVTYRSRATDAFETRVYDPIVRAVQVVAGWIRRAHAGSVHAYLAFGALGLLVVLAVTW
jgi:formate hydrogenlyase subunit 3/multisubunit Na+/H+ antiporter MnhD subunit